MSIKSVEVENFKCFQSLTLPTELLTVLTGYNAAGKSSVLQALLLLSQALNNHNDQSYISLNGDMTSLGNAGDVFCKYPGSDGKTINIRLESSIESIGLILSPSSTPRGKLKLEELEIFKGNNSIKLQNLRSSLEVEESDLIACIRGCVFVGLLRQNQTQTYPMPGGSSTKAWNVGRDGQYAPFVLYERSTDVVESMRRHIGESSETVQGQCDAWLNELFPHARVSASAIKSVDLMKLEFQNSKSSGWVKPENIGYGLSYAFPIIVALMTAPKDGILIIDSPEAHLHPRAQSKMGALIAKVAASGVQIFIETHSDHFLNGVRLATKEKQILADDVQIHFFGDESNKSSISSINLDHHGGVSHWPNGFFDQNENDLLELAEQ